VQSCRGPGGLPAYRLAQLLLQTRAFKLPSGPVLCPLIDLTNHLSAGANARTRLEGAKDKDKDKDTDKDTDKDSDGGGGGGGEGECGGECLVLRATRALQAGEEVFKNYDQDADYSDLFERYGFLDRTSSLHTAEVSKTTQ
jgi:hypothetical protein